jgi:hypothetical protein
MLAKSYSDNAIALRKRANYATDQERDGGKKKSERKIRDVDSILS